KVALSEAPPHSAAPVTGIRDINWKTWALAAWFAGVMMALATLATGTLRVHRTIRDAYAIDDAECITQFRGLCRALGLKRSVRLLASDQRRMPIALGLIRPAVLLPADAPKWSGDRRNVVLLHELAHVKRMDCFTQILTQVVRAFYWFNPLVHLAARHLRIEAERACDDYVLGGGARASDYAEHLLEIARSVSTLRRVSPAAASMARPSQLEARMSAILNPGVNRSRLGAITSLLVSLTIGVLILLVASVQPAAQGR